MRAMRLARSARASIAIARFAGSQRSHSIAIDPEPAPTSHKRSPRFGASDERATAANLPFGQLAIGFKPGIGKTVCDGKNLRLGSRGDFDRNEIQGIDFLHAKYRAVLLRMRSLQPPIASSTMIRDRPRPFSQRSFAIRGGVVSSHDKHRIFACGCRTGIIRSNSRPCREIRQHSCKLHLSRAAARLKAEGAGKHCISSGRTCALSKHFRRRKKKDRRRRGRRPLSLARRVFRESRRPSGRAKSSFWPRADPQARGDGCRPRPIGLARAGRARQEKEPRRRLRRCQSSIAIFRKTAKS